MTDEQTRTFLRLTVCQNRRHREGTALIVISGGATLADCYWLWYVKNSRFWTLLYN